MCFKSVSEVGRHFVHLPNSGASAGQKSPRVEWRILGTGWSKKLGKSWGIVGLGPGYYLVTGAAWLLCVAPQLSSSSHHTIIQQESPFKQSNNRPGVQRGGLRAPQVGTAGDHCNVPLLAPSERLSCPCLPMFIWAQNNLLGASETLTCKHNTVTLRVSNEYSYACGSGMGQ